MLLSTPRKSKQVWRGICVEPTKVQGSRRISLAAISYDGGVLCHHLSLSSSNLHHWIEKQSSVFMFVTPWRRNAFIYNPRHCHKLPPFSPCSFLSSGQLDLASPEPLSPAGGVWTVCDAASAAVACVCDQRILDGKAVAPNFQRQLEEANAGQWLNKSAASVFGWDFCPHWLTTSQSWTLTHHSYLVCQPAFFSSRWRHKFGTTAWPRRRRWCGRQRREVCGGRGFVQRLTSWHLFWARAKRGGKRVPWKAPRPASSFPLSLFGFRSSVRREPTLPIHGVARHLSSHTPDGQREASDQRRQSAGSRGKEGGHRGWGPGTNGNKGRRAPCPYPEVREKM